MVHHLKKYIALIIVISVIVISVAIYQFTKNTHPSIDFVVAKRGDLIQEVNVTGRVKPSESVNLAFELTGSVSRINVSIGSVVSKGELLVELKNAEKNAELAKAQANVKYQQAKLDELKRGYTQEEIDVQKVKISNAKASFVEAKRNLILKINEALTKSDDAIRNNIDQFIENPRANNPQFDLPVNNFSLKIKIENGRLTVESILNKWASLAPLLIDSNLSSAVNDAKNNLVQVKTLLDDISLAVNALTINTTISQATIDKYKADVSSARTSVNTALSNISVAEEKLQSAESILTLEEQELALKSAGTRVEQITAQEARIEEAIASVSSSHVAINKTYLYTPIGGIVTRQDAKVSEIVSANEVIVSIISQAEFEIEANIPEADIAKIKKGDMARVTLDAYGSDIQFTASVISVEPAETIIEGVATYKTVLYFSEKDDRIRPGMTANIDIQTAQKLDVILIPSRAVITKGGKRVVRVLDNQNNVVEREVMTGLRSSEGFIEIIEGIKEGDNVILFLEE